MLLAKESLRNLLYYQEHILLDIKWKCIMNKSKSIKEILSENLSSVDNPMESSIDSQPSDTRLIHYSQPQSLHVSQITSQVNSSSIGAKFPNLPSQSPNDQLISNLLKPPNYLIILWRLFHFNLIN